MKQVSAQIDRVQNRGTFLWTVISEYIRDDQAESFFRISNISVPCPHAQLRGRTVIKKLLNLNKHVIIYTLF